MSSDRSTAARDWPRGMREDTAAEYVGLSASGLRAASKVGGFAPVQLSPGRVVYLREDLDAWLDRRRAAPVEAAEPDQDWRAMLAKTR